MSIPTILSYETVFRPSSLNVGGTRRWLTIQLAILICGFAVLNPSVIFTGKFFLQLVSPKTEGGRDGLDFMLTARFRVVRSSDCQKIRSIESTAPESLFGLQVAKR